MSSKQDLISKLKGMKKQYETNILTKEPATQIVNFSKKGKIYAFGYQTILPERQNGQPIGPSIASISLKYKGENQWNKLCDYKFGVVYDMTDTEKATNYDELLMYKKVNDKEIDIILEMISSDAEAMKLFRKYLLANGKSYNNTKVNFVSSNRRPYL